MKNLIFLLSAVMLSLNIYSQETSQIPERPPIIDMHMHTGLPHEVPEGIPAICRPEPCKGDGHATTDPVQLFEKTMEQMDKSNIVLAFLSGVDLATVKKWKEASPERFIASPFILQAGKAELEKLKPDFQSGNFKGMGEIGTQLLGIGANDPLLEPYFDLAARLDIPVLLHSAGIGPYMPGFRTSAGSSLLLEKVLIKHPELRLFIENAGYPFRDEMIAMMYQYPQLYADVSTITWVIPRSAFYDYLEAFMNAGLGKRLLFGSDQMVWPEKIGAGIEAIENAPFLTKEQKRDIFYHNATRFLRLEDASQERLNYISNTNN